MIAPLMPPGVRPGTIRLAMAPAIAPKVNRGLLSLAALVGRHWPRQEERAP